MRTRLFNIRNTDVWPARYKMGMWVWILHRITGVIIVLYGIAHLWVVSHARVDSGASFDRLIDTFNKPWVKALELVLLAAILYHAVNGLRILLFDLGIGVRVQKQLFWGLMGGGAILMGFMIKFFWPLITD